MKPTLCRWSTLLAAVLGIILVGNVDVAGAAKHRRPFSPNIGLGYGFDHDAAGNKKCTNYTCGGNKCYDGHTGNDFPLGLGTDVLAGANGKVDTVVQGCADWGYLGNPCGGKCGNYVKLVHSDGSTSIYCHLKNGSVVVSKGQSVACGQKLGQSASSGSSTGYHLHFGWNKGGTKDPFGGGCSAGGGWVDQGAFGGAPGTGCESNCQCNPGQTQSEGCGKCGSRSRTCGGNCQWGGWSGCGGEGPCGPGQSQSEGCGNCGTRSRSCGGNCQWGGWSGCGGQGPCSPGAVEAQKCCDCGQISRVCSANCQWGGFSACEGPHPAGEPSCDTGKLGDCAIGALQCQGGCLLCVQLYEPSPELCDDRDNDCDGATDEQAPEMGVVPAAFAAKLVDHSAPASLAPGETATVWAQFLNVGSQSWPAGAAWIGVEHGGDPTSPLWHQQSWSAFDIPAALKTKVDPGQVAWVDFQIKMPNTPMEEGTRAFWVVHGAPVRCPAPDFSLQPVLLATTPTVSTPGASGPQDSAPNPPSPGEDADAFSAEDAAGEAPSDRQDAESVPGSPSDTPAQDDSHAGTAAPRVDGAPTSATPEPVEGRAPTSGCRASNERAGVSRVGWIAFAVLMVRIMRRRESKVR